MQMVLFIYFSFLFIVSFCFSSRVGIMNVHMGGKREKKKMCSSVMEMTNYDCHTFWKIE